MEDFSAAGTQQLSERECQQLMKDFPLWELASDSRSMSRTFVAKTFAEGLRFFNQIAELADVEGGHHPDLHLTESRTVGLKLFTSAVKGLTIQDFNLARQIDKHTILYSWKWLKANPRIIELLVQNQDKVIASDADTKRTDRKNFMSGLGELLQVGHEDAQGRVAPPPQLEQENVEGEGEEEEESEEESEEQGEEEGGEVEKVEEKGEEKEEGDDTLECKMLSDHDLEERLRFLSNWKVVPDRKSICRSFQARDFSEGIRFFNAVAKLAEEEGYSPELHLTEFRKVTVVLMTPNFQGVSSLDIIMAERINSIDVQYSEATGNFLQRLHGSLEPERSPSEDSEVSVLEHCPHPSVLEVQPPKNSSQRQNAPDANPQHRKANNISFTESSINAHEDTATLLHSLILVYANAGLEGLSIQEAVRRVMALNLPGLKQKAKMVQVAKITNNHPDFVACNGMIGCFALRRALLKSFQSGAVDAEAYADEKKLETSVLEKYLPDHSPTSLSMVQSLLPQPRNVATLTIRRKSSVAPTSGHRQPV